MHRVKELASREADTDCVQSINQSINQSTNQSINQLHLNTVNGSARWFSDMPCDNYKL